MECFCQVENMASALGKQINTDIPASLVEFDRKRRMGQMKVQLASRVHTKRLPQHNHMV